MISEWIVMFCMELTSQTPMEFARNPRNYDDPCPLDVGGKRELLLPEAGSKHHPTSLNSYARLLAAKESKPMKFAMPTTTYEESLPFGAVSGNWSRPPRSRL